MRIKVEMGWAREHEGSEVYIQWDWTPLNLALPYRYQGNKRPQKWFT